MTAPRLNLIVLRVADIDRAAAFYSQLGLTFDKHSHGSGPGHCSAELSGLVLELYPASASFPATSSVRIGFEVADLAAAVSLLTSYAGSRLVSPIADSEWGLRAVIADPDGHRIELTQSNQIH